MTELSAIEERFSAIEERSLRAERAIADLTRMNNELGSFLTLLSNHTHSSDGKISITFDSAAVALQNLSRAR